MIKNKRFLGIGAFLLGIIFYTVPGFSQIQNMDEFSDKRIEYYCQKNTPELYKKIINDLDQLRKHKDQYDPELFLTLENNIVVGAVTFYPKSPEITQEQKAKDISEMLHDQNNRSEEYMKNKKYEQLTVDFMVSLADIKSRLLAYLSTPKMVTEALNTKRLYTESIKKDENSASARTGYALWLYFAPGIAGGGVKKAYNQILQAETSARTKEDPRDLYFALIYKSQFLYDLKKPEETATTLEEAHKLYPKETLSSFMAEKNSRGIGGFQPEK